MYTLFQKFLAYVDTHFKTKVKTIRSDNGTEFFNKHINSLFDSLGIIHQHSCVETPQQNGRAERKHKHLLSVARALKFQSNVLIHLWGDCLLTATYLINRTPTSILQNKSPYEALFHKPPCYSHLKNFGCLCYASTLSLRQDKFASRAHKCIFLGYASHQKGYKLMNLNFGQYLVSRDVCFYETNYPFSKPTHTGSSLMFPQQQSFTDILSPIDKITKSPHITPVSSPPITPVLLQHAPPIASHDSSIPQNSYNPSLSHQSAETTISQNSHATSCDTSLPTFDGPLSVNPTVLPHNSRPVRTRNLPSKYSYYTCLPSTFIKHLVNPNTSVISEPQFYHQAVKDPLVSSYASRNQCS